MNLLALVNRTRLECGVSAAALTTLTSLPSEDQRVLNWVTNAWEDLQLHKPDWQFMKKSASFITINAQSTYTTTGAGAVDCADWKRDSFRCYTTASSYGDEAILPWMETDAYRDLYEFGAQRTATDRPIVFTILANKSIKLGPVPTAGYTILGEYYRKPTSLALTTDSPSDAGNDLDTRWHMLIVWLAMKSYASYEAAPEVLQRAEMESMRMLRRLEIDQLPELTFGLPLA